MHILHAYAHLQLCLTNMPHPCLLSTPCRSLHANLYLRFHPLPTQEKAAGLHFATHGASADVHGGNIGTLCGENENGVAAPAAVSAILPASLTAFRLRPQEVLFRSRRRREICLHLPSFAGSASAAATQAAGYETRFEASSTGRGSRSVSRGGAARGEHGS